MYCDNVSFSAVSKEVGERFEYRLHDTKLKNNMPDSEFLKHLSGKFRCTMTRYERRIEEF